MTVPPAKKNNDPNPCVRNCCLDDAKICLGCGRSLAEILEWHHADYHRQSQIVDSARVRLLSKPRPLFSAR